MFDNLTVLSFLAGILVFAFGFPASIVYTKMFPGTAFGVLFGDLVYTGIAFRLARKTGNTTITAMPLGLDTPSTIGIALVVLGPAFVSLKAQGMAPKEAALQTWYIGMATMVMIGVVKLALSFAAGGSRRSSRRPVCSGRSPASASRSSASYRCSTSSACPSSGSSRSG